MADFNTNDDLAWSDEFDTTNMQTVDYKQYFASKGYIVEEKTTDSGTGYIITSVGTNGKPDGGAIIIPPNSQETNTVGFFVCGQDGKGTTTYGTSANGPQLIIKAQENNEWPPYTVVISPNDLYDTKGCKSDGLNILNDAYGGLRANDVPVENIGGLGFSNGTYGCVWTVDKFLEQHPDDDLNARIYLADQYNVGEHVFKANRNGTYDRTEFSTYDGNELSTLKEKGVEITMSYRGEQAGGVHNGRKDVQLMDAVGMSMLGFNVQLAQRGEGTHLESFLDFFDGDWGYNYLAGVEEETVHSNGYMQLLNLSDEDFYFPIDENIVGSNSMYVYSKMNDMCTQIRDTISSANTTFAAASAPIITSMPEVSAKINECLGIYNNMLGVLMGKLYDESKVVVSVAETIDAMEGELTTHAEEIEDVNNEPIKEFAKDDTKSQTDNV